MAPSRKHSRPFLNLRSNGSKPGFRRLNRSHRQDTPTRSVQQARDGTAFMSLRPRIFFYARGRVHGTGRAGQSQPAQSSTIGMEALLQSNRVQWKVEHPPSHVVQPHPSTLGLFHKDREVETHQGTELPSPMVPAPVARHLPVMMEQTHPFDRASSRPPTIGEALC